jgi:hypothetical protein
MSAFGVGHQDASRLAGHVAHDLASDWVRGSAGPAEGADGRLVEDPALVEVHHEGGDVTGGGVDLDQGGHALLLELELAPPADHPDPLALWGHRGTIGKVFGPTRAMMSRSTTSAAGPTSQ